MLCITKLLICKVVTLEGLCRISSEFIVRFSSFAYRKILEHSPYQIEKNFNRPRNRTKGSVVESTCCLYKLFEFSTIFLHNDVQQDHHFSKRNRIMCRRHISIVTILLKNGRVNQNQQRFIHFISDSYNMRILISRYSTITKTIFLCFQSFLFLSEYVY